MKNILYYIVVFIVGFFIGRMTINIETEVKYVKGETVTNTVHIPEPYFVSTPIIPLFFYKTDKETHIQVVDTPAIIGDWILKRDYRQTVFDDTNGKLDIDLSVQYNQLQRFSYSFTPIQKEIIKYQEKVWQPFVSGSYSTRNGLGIGGGIFYHDIGIEYQYEFEDNHLIGLKYKF